MIRGEVRAQVATDEPTPEIGADVPARPRPPLLVRHSKKAAIALVLAILAASPFAYHYLQRNFGPDPLAGIKSDSVRFDANSGTMEIVKSGEVKSVRSDDHGR